jgi:hypothetical protein
MKTEMRQTLSLFPENHAESKQWITLLAPYSWAEGEFGMLLTEAAFWQFWADCANAGNVPEDIRLKATEIAHVLTSGTYSDICLEYCGVASTVASEAAQG